MRVFPKPSREFDLLGAAEHLERPDSVPIHVYPVPTPQAVPGGGRVEWISKARKSSKIVCWYPSRHSA